MLDASTAPTFVVDRCLGTKVLPDILRQNGLRVELLDDHFPQDCKDEEWLAEVGRREWVVLTKDKNIRKRELELQALLQAGVAAFVLTGGGMKGEAVAATFVKAIPRMLRLLQTHTRPLIATLTATGTVTVVHGQRRGGVKKGQ